mgnify:CR=1 FL=1
MVKGIPPGLPAPMPVARSIEAPSRESWLNKVLGWFRPEAPEPAVQAAPVRTEVPRDARGRGRQDRDRRGNQREERRDQPRRGPRGRTGSARQRDGRSRGRRKAAGNKHGESVSRGTASATSHAMTHARERATRKSSVLHANPGRRRSRVQRPTRCLPSPNRSRARSREGEHAEGGRRRRRGRGGRDRGERSEQGEPRAPRGERSERRPRDGRCCWFGHRARANDIALIRDPRSRNGA